MTGITPFQGYTGCLFITQGRRASRLPLAIIFRAVGALVRLFVQSGQALSLCLIWHIKLKSSNLGIDARFAEEVFAGCFGDQAELFEFEVGALDFAFVDGEFLSERGGGGEGVALGVWTVLDLF